MAWASGDATCISSFISIEMLTGTITGRERGGLRAFGFFRFMIYPDASTIKCANSHESEPHDHPTFTNVTEISELECMVEHDQKEDYFEKKKLEVERSGSFSTGLKREEPPWRWGPPKDALYCPSCVASARRRPTMNSAKHSLSARQK
jgi:hypothetical protein